jgi:phospholipid transport system substrate-binding protein
MPHRLIHPRVPAARAVAALGACVALWLAAPLVRADGPAAPGDAAASATAVVETFHSALLDMMKGSDDMSFDDRVAYLTPKLGEAFDMDFMSSKSVGREWKQLSSEQQRAWREKFERLTISNYAGRFVGYEGEAFETLGNEPAARDTVMVLTRVTVPGDQDVDLSYRLRETRAGWRIIAVYLKRTVSELALRRSEYSSTLKRDGFEKLATAIDEKIAELREEADGGSSDG